MIKKKTYDAKLVVAKMRPDGSIDHSSIQPLDQWQRGPRDLDLMRHGYGHELLDILTTELNLVSVKDGLLSSNIVIVTSEEDVRTRVMQLLGRIAEALIVRSCNSEVNANRRWGQIARRGANPHRTLDQYIAIGTGLETTRRNYLSKFQPNDTQRDVIWVHHKLIRRELEMLVSGQRAGYAAGLQLKVSMDGFRYIYSTDIRRAKYEVPLVYFDLCNDYFKLTNAIYREDRQFEPGVDLVRGKDIDPAIHDRLCSYWWLTEKLVRGQMTIDELVSDELLLDANQNESMENSGSKIITL